MTITQDELSLRRIQDLKAALVMKEDELERAKTIYKAVKEERDKAEQRLFYSIDHADQSELQFDAENES